MSVLLGRAYMGYPAGVVADFASSVEAALIAQGLATASAALPTAGNTTTLALQGSAAVAAAAGSVTISHPQVDASTKIWACIGQAAADGTALYVARVVPAVGSFTIYMNANATAITVVDWAVLDPLGMTPSN